MEPTHETVWERITGFLLANKVLVVIPVALLVLGGMMSSPFGWNPLGLPRHPMAVDAIPDTGENQQIVFTEWPGRSPKDIEDQITYPLTTTLLSVPGVRTVRSQSMFGFSSIYVIFEEDIEFFWSRARLLERISSLPEGFLPEGASPRLGPEATALGQIYWYTLEGRSPEGELVGGWDRDELRTIQDFTVRFALQAVSGVAEVASIGGFVREYQVDVNPEALRAHGVTLAEVAHAVQRSNQEIGARTLEINNSEYLVRSRGFIEGPGDLEEAVVAVRDNVPIRVRDVARVGMGPADRRGALDDAGAEAVGGVVVARYGANPREVIDAVKAQIAIIAPTLPARVLEDGTMSQVTIAPFYDRTTLIDETIDTLGTALRQQILITILVVVVLLGHLRSSALISSMVPLAVLVTFLAMRLSGITANVMSLAGIAIAIGTMVDIGIVLVENVVRRLGEAPDQPRPVIIRRAVGEVAPAVITSVATTVVSFLPVFALTAAEGKLFRPLAFTKSYALIASVVLGVVMVPVLAYFLASRTPRAAEARPRTARQKTLRRIWTARIALVAAAVTVLLAMDWQPLGVDRHLAMNLLFTGAIVALVLGGFALFQRAYPTILGWCLQNKFVFLILPGSILLFGVTAWLGFGQVFGWLPGWVKDRAVVAEKMPGLGSEYMPPLDEGSYLVMPSTMPHASFGQALELLQQMDAAIAALPEVDRVVGKLGRLDSPLDPAPVPMYEIVVTYKPEYSVDEQGRRVRNWRDHVRVPRDIWNEIARAAAIPGVTPTSMLMPIETRRLMLQTGMRGSMGVRIRGPDLDNLERAAVAVQEALRQVAGIDPGTVNAERVVGKPYLEIDLDRSTLARYGLNVADVQELLSVALGGMPLSRSVEGRERYPIRVRYMREDRDSLEALGRVLVATPMGEHVPLAQVARFEYVRGPEVIKSEDTFKTAYVTFGKIPELSEVEVVKRAGERLQELIDEGALKLPAGVTYEFAGSYENQVRSKKRLGLLLPVTLSLVFFLLYLQFRRVTTTLIVYTGVAVAVAGGFVLLWLYGRPGFLDFSLFGTNMRELFQVGTINMSVAVWVGIIALIGIATDDGVVMATYLDQQTARGPAATIEDVRARVLIAGKRRIRACLMTTATTLLALLPVITSQGRGSDVMVPMAIPVLGGMIIELITLFVVPVLYCLVQEIDWHRRKRAAPITRAP
jgi:copper/silver efflux system protein